MNLAPVLFSLRQLQYAVAVAETLSFRKAAARCRVAQPSLSTQLAQLEQALGTRLFERDKKNVMLSEAGRVLIPRMERLLLDAHEVSATARQLTNPLEGRLRVGIIPTISSYLLPSLTRGLSRAFPKLSVYWREEQTETLMAKLHGGELDGAVVALEADLGDVEKTVIAEDPFVLVAARQHALAAIRRPLRVADLVGASVLLLDDGHCLRRQALEVCSLAKVRQLEFRATSLATLAQMVDAGVGVTLLPTLAVRRETKGTRLVVRPFAAPVPFRTVALVWRRRSGLTDAFASVAAVMRKHYPDEGTVSTSQKPEREARHQGATRSRTSPRMRVGVRSGLRSRPMR